MDEIVTETLKAKIFEYIRGDSSVNDLFEWAKTVPELAASLPNIREKSDIIFFLINRAGLETRSFYIEEKIKVKKSGIVKNIKRLIQGHIGCLDLYNWADDVWNWELVDGYEDDIASSAIEHLTLDPERIERLEREDLEKMIWHLEKSTDSKGSIEYFEQLFTEDR